MQEFESDIMIDLAHRELLYSESNAFINNTESNKILMSSIVSIIVSIIVGA